MVRYKKNKKLELKNLTIIVPIYNESKVANALASSLIIWMERGCEVIVVDGKSTDNSVDILLEKGIKVLLSEKKGRAVQMNFGAQHSTRDYLLFLHADTYLPKGSDDLIVASLIEKQNYIWGRFNIEITGNSKVFIIIGFMINWRSRISKIATGDQAIFVRKDKFYEVGGYKEQPLMEDIELSKSLLKISPPLCLTSQVKTSGRRWEKYGIYKTIALMWKIRFLYWLGVSSETLSKEY